MSKSRYPGLTLDEHRECAGALRQAIHWAQRVGLAYPRTGRQGKATRATLRDLTELRAALDDHVGKLMDSMFARAMSDGEPTEDQYHIARVISDVWLSNLLAWLTRRASATDVSKRLDLAVRLLIGDGEHPKI